MYVLRKTKNCSLQIVRVASKEYNKIYNITLRDKKKLCSVRKPVRGHNTSTSVRSRFEARPRSCGRRRSFDGRYLYWSMFGDSQSTSTLKWAAVVTFICNETTFISQEYTFLPFRYTRHAVTNNYFHLVCKTCKTCCEICSVNNSWLFFNL